MKHDTNSHLPQAKILHHALALGKLFIGSSDNDTFKLVT